MWIAVAKVSGRSGSARSRIEQCRGVLVPRVLKAPLLEFEPETRLLAAGFAVRRAVCHDPKRPDSEMAGGCRAFGLRGGAVALVGAFELQLDGGAFGVAGFGDDHFGESGLCVFVVAVGAVQQQDGVGVLFEGAGVAEV